MQARSLLLLATLVFGGCAAGSQATLDVRTDADAVAQIAAALDDFHAAAAEADAERYLNRFTTDGVFFGTDPAERWTVQQFEPYVREAFAQGGWAYRPEGRTIFVSEDGRTAWFDETLDGGTLIARGTGVLVRHADDWKVAQYNFSVPFPNSLWDTIAEMIRAETE